MLLSYNNYPYSAYACEDGVKHLIGDSKSIFFNHDKFEYALDEKAEYLETFKTRESAFNFAKSLDIPFCIRFNDNISIIFKKGVFKSVFINEQYNRYSKEIEFCVFIITRIKGKIRDSYYDERSIILKESCTYNCIICNKKDILDYESSIIVFDIENKFRSECVCDECAENTLKYKHRYLSCNHLNKDKVLINLLSIMDQQ